MWFEELMGFRETSPETVRSHISVSGATMISVANGRRFACGKLAISSLGELRASVPANFAKEARTTLRQVVADVRDLYEDPANAGAMFQVASQFNLLEMVSPGVTPEQGVDGYERDFTQGPVSAIAAGAGTIYRNYFVEVNGRFGQSADNQIDCLEDLRAALADALQVPLEKLWTMRNGYALLAKDELELVNGFLKGLPEERLDEYRSHLRIGIHSNVEVTLDGAGHLVSQAYCSALPIAYCPHFSAALWEPFAKLVLDAAYEATFAAAAANLAETGNNTLFLTQLGGGVFGNDPNWILAAIERSLLLYAASGLDVAVVSYGRSDPLVNNLILKSKERLESCAAGKTL